MQKTIELSSFGFDYFPPEHRPKNMLERCLYERGFKQIIYNWGEVLLTIKRDDVNIYAFTEDEWYKLITLLDNYDERHDAFFRFYKYDSVQSFMAAIEPYKKSIDEYKVWLSKPNKQVYACTNEANDSKPLAKD